MVKFMNNVNKTLYIPLYGKAYVSQKGLFLDDKKAEEIWSAEGFALKGKSKSKWLAYYMGIRAAVFDEWVKAQLAQTPNAAVLHIGCGMDSRVLRVGGACKWYDVDFPDVITERKRYYTDSDSYQMLAGDLRNGEFLDNIPQAENAVVVMEGVSMYVTNEELQAFTEKLGRHFTKVSLLMDCYTTFAAKMSKYKNPINDVGVTSVHGLDDPKTLEREGLAFVQEREMTPSKYVEQLHGMEKKIFQKLYAGKFAKKLYRVYEYKTR